LGTRKKPVTPTTSGDFDSLVSSIVRLHRQTQDLATKAVNVALTLRNWLIGHHIVEFEQKGRDRAAYGEQLMDALSQRLVPQGLNRATPRELRRFRQFYQAYPHIWESATPKSLAETGLAGIASLLPTARPPIRESLTPESQIVETASPQWLSPNPELLFRLSFTHLAEIISLEDETQRRFYEIECIRGNWSVRELKRQIASLYYQRSGLSQDKAALSKLAHQTAETARPAHVIRDPYVFEFLGLRSRDVTAESDLEDALLDRLQDFLLELGHGFCFEARQKRILIGDEHFFVDLVFYHRVLKCHILVELKTDAFRHEHLGQLNTYVAYYKKHQMTPGDQPHPQERRPRRVCPRRPEQPSLRLPLCRGASRERGNGTLHHPSRQGGGRMKKTFKEKMARLIKELHAQFAESATLEAQIKRNLEGLGYGR